MKILPYDTLTVKTDRSLADIIHNLEVHIEEPQGIRWTPRSDRALYSGTISESGFEIHRIIHYRNSFLPRIKGQFEPSRNGTIVRATLSLHPFITAFSIFWWCMWYSIAIPICLAGWLSDDIGLETILPLGMPIAIFFIFWCAFWTEANRSRHELTEMILGRSLESRSTKTRSSKIIRFFIIAAIVAGNAIALHWYFSSGRFPTTFPTEIPSCSQSASAACNFSIAHTLTEQPTASTLALTPDGKTLISGGRDKAIKVWDAQTGELQKTLQSDSGEIVSLAISADGRTAISGSRDRMVRIWDIPSGTLVRTLAGHSSSYIDPVGISADDRTAISVSFDEVKAWNRDTGEAHNPLPEIEPKTIEIGPIYLVGSPPRFRALDIAPDGNTILAQLGGKVVAWDLASDRQTVLPKRWLADFNAGQIAPDGKTTVTTSYIQPKTHLQVWDLTTAEHKAELKAEALVSSAREHWGYNDRIALSRDRIFAGTPEGLKVWDLATAELEAVLDIEPMRHLVASEDGTRLVGMTGDAATGNVKIHLLQQP
ncbi:MAG: hypothetical protein SWY16_19685 [Cyanobacteriota bacterium]|nr:hypothetical protein [Cyanobacteriota bacterium]